jgi:DNA ligase-1
VVHRGRRSFVWSRGEEVVTDRSPELEALADALPDGTVIDGENLPWKAGRDRRSLADGYVDEMRAAFGR